SYGQGSFVFDMNAPGSNWERGYLINFEISRSFCKASVIGVKQFSSEPKTEVLNLIEQQQMNTELEQLNKVLMDDILYQNRWNLYLEQKKKEYYGSILFPTAKWTRRLVRRFNFGKFVSR